MCLLLRLAWALCCDYCGEEITKVTDYCPKNSNGHRYGIYPQTNNKSNNNDAYGVGVALANALTPFIAALFKWLFRKPKVLAGLIFRGLIFGVVGFFVGGILTMAITEDAITSRIMGGLVAVAVFGLYFWFFRKKIDG